MIQEQEPTHFATNLRRKLKLGGLEFISLLNTVSTRFRRWHWKVLYNLLATQVPDGGWIFMNYGFSPQDASRKNMAVEGTLQSSSAQLYHYVASQVDLRDLEVLEIGCGRGGGSAYISRVFHPKRVVGVDIAPNAIKFCSSQLGSPILSFMVGDAESLSYSSESFDVVVNIESSHCYGTMQRFLWEVRRVLRDHGYLLFADLRKLNQVPLLKDQFAKAGFLILREETITNNVLRALSEDSDRKLSLIKEKAPRWLRKPLAELAATKGSLIYESLSSQRSEYVSYVLRKVEDAPLEC